MKKYTLLLIMLTCLLNVNAQQYVSTEVSNRNLLIEEFTGRNCPNCPLGHAISNDITHSNHDHAWSIGIHSGYFTPVTYPNFNTDISAVITDAYGDNLSYPSALLNRSTEQPIGRGEWEAAAGQQLQQIAECNVDGHVVINPLTRTASITAEVYYTANSLESTNYLTIVMVQDSIVGEQAYAVLNPEQDLGDDMYCHMHVLRDVVTADWGDVISPTTQGSLVTKTYEYIIPDTIGNPNGVYVDLDNIYFIAYVTEKFQGTPTRPILNVNKLSQEQNAGDDVAPYIADLMVPEGFFCSSERTFKNYIKNVGNVNLTSLKFELEIENGDVIEYSWEGNIAPDATERIDIVGNLPFGNNAVTSNIVEANGASFDFSKTMTFNCDEWDEAVTTSMKEELTIHFVQDKHGFQNTWELIASDGSVIINGGPYQPLTEGDTATLLHENKVMVDADDCYKFVVYDAMGNGICCKYGDGYYRIKDSRGNIIVDGDGDFDYSAYNVFSVDLVDELPLECQTLEATEITSTSAVLNAKLLGGNPSEVGFMIKESEETEWESFVAELENDTFSYKVEGLSSSVTYIFKAYAKDDEYVYGEEQTFSTVVGIDDVVSSSYQIYPNPVDNVLTVKGNNINQIDVYNSIGQKVMTVDGNENAVNINVESLMNGIYFVDIIDDNGAKTTVKISKVR